MILYYYLCLAVGGGAAFNPRLTVQRKYIMERLEFDPSLSRTGFSSGTGKYEEKIKVDRERTLLALFSSFFPSSRTWRL